MRHLVMIPLLSPLLALAGCTKLPATNPGIDLAVTSATSSPSTPQDGQPLTLNFTIANNNTNGTALTGIPWEIVRDGVSGFKSGTIATLAAGASSPQSVTFTESGGSHTYEIQVAPGNIFNEANLANNQRFLILTVTGTPATLDLSFNGTPTITPSDPNTSQLITIGFSVTNTTSTGNAVSAVHYSVIRDGANPFQGGSITSIPANGSRSAAVSFTESAPGSHTYTIFIDPQNTIHETNETNNTFALSATVAATGIASR